MNYKNFNKLNLKEKVKFFEKNNIDFITKGTAENVHFKEKGDKVLICFYDNERSDWAILNKLYDLGSNFYVDYTVVNANGEYDESASLIPIRKLSTKDILDYNDDKDKKIKIGGNLLLDLREDMEDYVAYFKEKMLETKYYKRDLNRFDMEKFIRNEVVRISNKYTNLKLKDNNKCICSNLNMIIYDSNESVHDTLFVKYFVIKNIIIGDLKEFTDKNIIKDSYEKKLLLSLDGTIIEK